MSHLEILDSRVAEDIRILDHDTNRKLPAWFFVPQAVIAVSDTTETRRFLHELVAMENELQEFETAGLFIPQMFYTDPAPRGKEYTGYKQKIRQGRAQLVSRSANKFPKTNSQIKAHLAPIAPIALGYEVNYFDQESSAVYGQDIDRDGMLDTRTGILEGADFTGHFGGETPDGVIVNGFIDFLNGGSADAIKAGTSFYKLAASTGANSSKLWAQKSGKEIFEEFGRFMHFGFKNTMSKRMYNKVSFGFNLSEPLMTKTLIDEDNGINTTMTVERAIRLKYPNTQLIVNPNLDNIKHALTTGETWDGGADDNALFGWNDNRSNYKLILDPINVIRPYTHSGFVTEINVFSLVSSFMPKSLVDFGYMKEL